MARTRRALTAGLALAISLAPTTANAAPEQQYPGIEDVDAWILGQQVVVSGYCFDEPDNTAQLQVKKGKTWVTLAKAEFIDDAAYCEDDEHPYLTVYRFTLADLGRRYSIDRSYRLTVRTQAHRDADIYTVTTYRSQEDYDADVADADADDEVDEW